MIERKSGLSRVDITYFGYSVHGYIPMVTREGSHDSFLFMKRLFKYRINSE